MLWFVEYSNMFPNSRALDLQIQSREASKDGLTACSCEKTWQSKRTGENYHSFWQSCRILSASKFHRGWITVLCIISEQLLNNITHLYFTKATKQCWLYFYRGRITALIVCFKLMKLWALILVLFFISSALWEMPSMSTYSGLLFGE